MLYLFSEVRGVGEADELPPTRVRVERRRLAGILGEPVARAPRPIPAHWEAGVWLVQPLTP